MGEQMSADSIAGDVIDHEWGVSGERKHGLFFAFWHRRCAGIESASRQQPLQD